MTFEPYDPGDRSLSGGKHVASWLVLGVLIGLLAMVGSEAASLDDAATVASSEAAVVDCAT
ncbi:MAG: hypothetical protein ACR2Q4_01965 [Geminicoccaceae bacterium]